MKKLHKNVRCKVCHSEDWSECWTVPLKVRCSTCKKVTDGEGTKLYEKNN